MKRLVFSIVILCTVVISSVHIGNTYPVVSSTQELINIIRKNTDSIVIFSVFASFCSACKKEVPILNKIREERKDIRIFGFALDEQKAPLDTFIKETKLAYPVSMLSFEVAQDIGIDVVPQLFIYKNGVLIKHIVGLIEYEELLQYLK